MIETPPAIVTETDNAFHVRAYEKIDYSLLYVDGAFAVANSEIADAYRRFGRCPVVIDDDVHRLHGHQLGRYFAHHGIELTVFPVTITEIDKSLPTVEKIVGAFTEFGFVRKEPVLVVGGGSSRMSEVSHARRTGVRATTSGCRRR